MPSIIQDEVQQCGGKLFIFSNLRSIISDNITSLVEIIREVVINLLVKFDRRVYLLVLDLTLFKSARLFFTDIVDELDNRPDSGDACGAVEDLHRSYWSTFLTMKLRRVSRSPFLYERSVAIEAIVQRHATNLEELSIDAPPSLLDCLRQDYHGTRTDTEKPSLETSPLSV